MGTEPLSPEHIGRIVRVRQRQFLVDDVSPGKASSSTIAKLSCVDPDHLGRPLEVIWEQELDAQIPTAETWGLLGGRGFDPPDRFSAYYHTLRWNRVTASPAPRPTPGRGAGEISLSGRPRPGSFS